ncbi:MAG: hypothetical protein FWE93_01920 [Alphaproteobacteria bacterium]|nr:hypothetical protein [Alphaproteobacteria bacterium]
MENTKKVALIGNEMQDLTVHLKSEEAVDFINSRLESINPLLPKLTLDGGQIDNNPELHAVLNKIIWNYFDNAYFAPGGSCYNTEQAFKVAAEALCGEKAAKRLLTNHIATADVDAVVINLPNGEKFLCKHQTVPDVALTEEQKAWLADSNVLYWPLSTANNFSAMLTEAIDTFENVKKAGAEIIATFHGATSTPVKNWDLMMKATIWIGNEKEIGLCEEHTDLMCAKFLEKGGMIIETLGEHGLNIITKNTVRNYPALKVQDVLSTAGCGNGVEAAAMLRVLSNPTKVSLDEFAAAMTAMGGVIAGIKETTITKEQVPDVLKAYDHQLQVIKNRSAEAAPAPAG